MNPNHEYRTCISINANPSKHTELVRVLNARGISHADWYSDQCDKVIERKNTLLISVLILIAIGTFLYFSRDKVVQWVMPSLDQVDDRR